MIHLRMIVPAHASPAVVAFLRDDPRTTHLVVLPGAALDPPGDSVSCDVAREAATEVIEELRRLGCDAGRGAIVLTEVEAVLSDAAEAAERAAPGSPDDGIVWDLVERRATEDARSSWAYYAFLSLAVTLAAIAVITDSAILVIGAMVVSPEFGPVAAIATGIVLHRPGLTLDSIRLLVLGFAAAIAVTCVLALAARSAGWITPDDLLAPRPLTGFIWRPDRWSFVVSLLAGAAGVLSLTAGRASALIGVFISVTTVPAAGDLALAFALWVPAEMRGSAAQLAVNLAGMVIAGTALLALQRVLSRRRGAFLPTPRSPHGAAHPGG